MAENNSVIQIVAYREFTDNVTKTQKLKQELMAEGTDIIKMFANADKIVKTFKEQERYNLHYTNAYCVPKSKFGRLREFVYQEIIPFDLDGIDLTRQEEYIEAVFKVIKAEKDKTSIICSGNGLHIIVALDYQITDLKEHKPYYNVVCSMINDEFIKRGLPGSVDKIRLMEAATLRFPFTINRKDEKPDTYCHFIYNNLQRQPFYLKDVCGDIPLTEIHGEKYHSVVDTQAVLNGCLFLKHSLANAATLSEPEWYAMIGVLAFIPEIGTELCHTYSRGHEGYDYDQTQAKIDQVLYGVGKPRKCSSIEEVFPACNTCPYYKMCKTPLQITSSEFIATESTGFHMVELDKLGQPKKFIPNYDDLVKFYKRMNTFVVASESGIVHKYNGKHWEQVEKIDLEHFATTHFKPVATNAMRGEFLGLIKSTNVVSETFFENSTEGYINFNNGILKLDGRILLPHSKDYGFQYCLPYDYNPHATAPNFEKMLESVTLKDVQLQKILLEYMAYAISNIPPSWGEKCLILDGNGANGKSTFLDIIRHLVGEKSYSSIPLTELMGKATSRQATVGKLFNICEETEHSALRESSMFRAMVTGGTTSFKKLYHQEVTLQFKAKLIIACNKIPPTNDDSNGTYRRMLIIPFRNNYTKTKGNLDKDIRKKIHGEMSGVYNLVLDAYDRLIEQKGFSDAAASEEALTAYKAEVDVVAQFFDSEIITTGNPNDYIDCKLAFDLFRSWAEQTNNKHAKNMSMITFGKKVRAILGARGTETRRENNRTFRVYEGVMSVEEGRL